MTARQVVLFLVGPTSAQPHRRRRQYILNILSFGSFCLAGLLFLDCLINYWIAPDFDGNHPAVTLLAALLFCGIWVLSRKGMVNTAAYLFVGLFLVAATQPLLKWGILLPQGILTYSLVIVMAGVLISSSAAIYVTALAALMLMTLTKLEHLGILTFDTDWMSRPAGYNDVVAYAATFTAIAVVSWLSNREIERSLRVANESQAALVAERNLLEVKVRQRTEQLEQAQIAQMLELHRFAEFGRLTSTLLHEIANPLSAISLNLEVLEDGTKSNILTQIRQGISHMESYITATRRQLQHESEISIFDASKEIKLMTQLLSPRARINNVNIATELQPRLRVKGDSIRFDHLISNLTANAIDAYANSTKKSRIVTVKATSDKQFVTISVIDQGVGISKTDLVKIFDPFFTKKLKQRGTGIGLSIVKQIVEKEFYGHIEVTSKHGAGTTFTIILPVAPKKQRK